MYFLLGLFICPGGNEKVTELKVTEDSRTEVTFMSRVPQTLSLRKKHSEFQNIQIVRILYKLVFKIQRINLTSIKL